ncbi:MAG: DUF262 domain-containing protein, partial [Hymenobacter sp.]
MNNSLSPTVCLPCSRPRTYKFKIQRVVLPTYYSLQLSDSFQLHPMELKTLPHFFNQRVYSIPDYQRGYSWQEEHVKALLQDLVNAHQLDNTHFTGTITIHRQSKDERIGLSTYHHYHLVDGQQRFTTIVLIMAYLIGELKKQPEHQRDAEEKERAYLKNRDHYIFSYAEDDVANHHFRARILELEAATTTDGNLYTQNLTEAKKTIQKFFSQPENSTRLPEFLHALESRLRFGEYIVESAAQIGVLFETMNNRGVGLSIMEIVKNRLLYLTTKLTDELDSAGTAIRLTKEINTQWARILRNLTLPERTLDEDDFLLNHWVVYNGYDPAVPVRDQILSSAFTIDAVVSDAPAMARKIHQYISSLAEHSLYWRYLNAPAKAFEEVTHTGTRNELREWFSKLARLQTGALRPVFLAFFPLLRLNRANELVRLAKLSELFAFRLFAMNRRRADTGKNFFWRAAHSWNQAIDDSFTLPSALHSLAQWTTWYGAVDRFQSIVDEWFNAGSKEGYYSWPGLTYFLYEHEEQLQQHASGNPKVKWSFAQKRAQSIEHIYPQTPENKCWKDSFKGYKKSQLVFFQGSLGNLLPLSQSINSSLQNDCFNDKKKPKYENNKRIRQGYL